MKKILFSVVVMAMLWSCGKDDSPTPSVDENSVPVITAKTFTVAETISDTEVIGKVTATDADDDALTFSIATNSDALFEITAAGDLSLASGKTLDAATKEQHAITVKVDDGEDTASATITIKVTAVAPTNQAPEMADQEFKPLESITDADEIGQVTATDPDGDTLTFSITDSELFVISDAGMLTLAEGKTLDFETETTHSITVSVTDGEKSIGATITVSVQDVAEADPNDKAAFVTKWETTAPEEAIYIGAHANYEYDFTINWGDGTLESIDTIPENNVFGHIYAEAGTYTVSIAGKFPTIKMSTVYDSFGVEATLKLMSMEQWGTIVWQSLESAFFQCKNMVYNAIDVPDLSKVVDVNTMFGGAEAFNGDLSGWDVSNVTNMASMFKSALSFNGNISGWDTSNVTNMGGMFFDATSFNGDISGWDTSNVTHMSSMFRDATSFNGDISGWDTSNVTIMFSMFNGTSSFDQDLGGWDIGSVTSMENMLNNSGMSKENYGNTLIGWSNFVDVNNGPSGIGLGASGLEYCLGTEAVMAIDNLYGADWSILGHTGVDCN